MKELPKPAVMFILAVAFLLLGYLAWQIKNGSLIANDPQYLDEIDIQTDNPQPAGRNVIP